MLYVNNNNNNIYHGRVEITNNPRRVWKCTYYTHVYSYNIMIYGNLLWYRTLLCNPKKVVCESNLTPFFQKKIFYQKLVPGQRCAIIYYDIDSRLIKHRWTFFNSFYNNNNNNIINNVILAKSVLFPKYVFDHFDKHNTFSKVLYFNIVFHDGRSGRHSCN